MRIDLIPRIPSTTEVSVGSVTSSSALSLTQQVLSEWGWEDLRPAILAAEQVNHEIGVELQAAQAAYKSEPQERQRARLQAALDQAIKQLQSDFKRVNSLKEAAQQRLVKASESPSSSSYFGQLGDWVLGSLQSFFSSDEAGLIERYNEIARNRTQAIADLTRYRRDLETINEEDIVIPTENIVIPAQAGIHFSPGADVSSEIDSRLRVNDRFFRRESRDVLDENEAEIIEFNTNDGEKIPAESRYSHSHQLLSFPLTDEFRVNTNTSYWLCDPRITSLNPEGFVVVWESDREGMFLEVYAQRYSSAGVAQGAEFRVNTNTIDYQYDPSIAGLNSGGFVVVWSSNELGEESGWRVYAQRYSSAGVAQGTEFRVNNYTGVLWQEYPSVTGLNPEGFVVAWIDYRQDGSGGVYAQRYSSAGVAQGTEFRVNTNTTGYQISSRITSLNPEGFVVAWTSAGQDGSGYGVYAQRYSSAGVAQGSEFRVNTNTTGDQVWPRITSLNPEGFVVVWAGDGESNWGRVYARRYSSAGVAQGAEFQVSTNTPSSQYYPSVTGLNSGGFVVAWGSNEQDGSGSGVYARLISGNNQIPVLEKNTLAMKDGDMIVLISSILSATDADIDYNAMNLNFIIDNIQHGHFAFITNLSEVILQFTQAQVQAGQICFVHDNSNQAPSYSVSVSDGELMTASQPAVIIFNSRPMLVNNIVSLKEGDSIVMTTAMLSAADDKTIADSLLFSVSAIQHGQFEFLSRLGAAITQFIQAQIQAGQIRFIHDGSHIAPSYLINVNDGELSSTSIAANITFDQSPVLVNHVVSLKDGESLIITETMLSATDDKTPTGSLLFSVSAIQNGQFELASSSGGSIAQFTQAQVQASQVRFVHAGNNQAPSFNVSVSDGALTTTAQPATITFNFRPVLNHNELSLKDGETLPITSSMISGTDGGSLTASLTCIISNVQHGQFEFVSGLGIAITQFTQAEVQAGQIRFVHDGSNQAPGYNISVSDGYLTSSPQPAVIIFNFKPMMGNHKLILQDGETLIITPSLLSATDNGSLVGSLTFTVSNMQHGQFEFVNYIGTEITEFTQAQVQAGEVWFVHDGHNLAPSYQVSVSDGVFNSTPAAGSITFDQRPMLINNVFALKDGESIVITSAMLSATDDKTSAGLLLFSVSAIQNGRFEWVSTPGSAITQFTQAQVQASQVRFVHDGSNQAPGYNISVSDGDLTSSPQSAIVTFNFKPVMGNNKLILQEGETLIITSSLLSATDNGSLVGSLTFTISNVQHGRFELISDAGVAITEFTQDQVQTGEVRFVHDGGNLAPSYQVSVSDGEWSLSVASAIVTFNRRPVITTNQLMINEGETVTLSAAMLAVNDDQPGGALTFSVFNLQGGYFALTALSDAPIQQFTMAQIQARQVVFVQSGASTAPSYSLTVSDGSLTSPPSTVMMAFNPRPVLVYNSLNLKGQGLAINITSTQLQVRDNQPDTQLTLTASNVQNGHFELTTSPGVNVTQFTQADVKAGRVRFIRTNLIDLPNYDMSVSDGILSTSLGAATVSFNARPMLSANALLLRDGESVIISTSMLHAVDDDLDSQLTFTIANLQGGWFELTTAAGVNITQFTQQQIGAGQVRFVHDGGNQAPRYTVSVSDGELSTMAEAVAVTFNPRPVITTNTLTLNDGESIILTPTILNTTDDQSPEGLTYTVNSVQQGHFEGLGSPGVATTQFTQQQVIEGQIRFIHAGSNVAPSYQLSVSDGILNSALSSPTIFFNQRPVLTGNNTLVLKDGEIVVITLAMFNASDDKTSPGALLFAVDAVQNGQFELTDNPGVVITQFTQAQIQTGGVRFVHIGNNQAPSYTLRVSDGVLTTTAQQASITFHRRPIFTHHHLVLTKGQATVITPSMLSADSDSAPASIVFSVNNIQHGRFTHVSTPDVAITQFTQEEITAGQIQFVPDGSGVAPDYDISLSDSYFDLSPVDAKVTFSSPPTSPNLGLILGAAIAGGGGVVAIMVIMCVIRYNKERSPSRTLREIADRLSALEFLPLNNNPVPASKAGIISPTGELKLDFNIRFEDLLYHKEEKPDDSKDFLGYGGYAAVYKGTYEGSVVAIKKLHSNHFSEKALEEFRKEAGIMASIRSNYLPVLYGICLESSHFCLVMEYMPKGSLHSSLQKNENLSLLDKYQIALDISRGLEQLHKKNILHRDLTSLNVLLDDGWRAKISDFGLAQIKSEIKSVSSTTVGEIKGARAWLAPERLEGKAATKESDIYSFGLILWELIVTPYHIPTEGIRPIIPDTCPPKFAKLMSKCWEKIPAQRPSISDLVFDLEKLKADEDILLKTVQITSTQEKEDRNSRAAIAKSFELIGPRIPEKLLKKSSPASNQSIPAVKGQPFTSELVLNLEELKFEEERPLKTGQTTPIQEKDHKLAMANSAEDLLKFMPRASSVSQKSRSKPISTSQNQHRLMSAPVTFPASPYSSRLKATSIVPVSKGKYTNRQIQSSLR